MKTKISIFWFRRDLRLEDNTGLSQALKSGLHSSGTFRNKLKLERTPFKGDYFLWESFRGFQRTDWKI